MKTSIRTAVPALLALGLLALGPAVGADPEGDHPGPGSTGPDQHSKNVKLLANVPRQAGTTTQTDLAFEGKLVYAGFVQGFRVIDASDPENPVVISDFRCNGSQSDVSVYGGLLFQSVDTPQSSGACNSTNTTASTPGMFEGVRIFDVSNPAAPVHLTSVPTDCGSHTHTLVPDGDTVYVYVSSYPLGGGAQGPNCRSLEGGGGHSKISIIEVPVSNPTAATVSAYNLDPGTQWGTYLGFTFRACHDISVFVEPGLAAAACLTEGQLWDISDPENPEFLWRYDNPNIKPENIDLFHSSSFSWDGSIVAFGDESGGGGAARCTNPEDNQGRIWFVETEDATELGSYKIPRSVPTTCTMHNFNFIPRRDGRNILVSSAYTGGTTIVDVDELLAGASEAEAEVGYYVPDQANAWSSYWYNGFIYSNGTPRGVDIFLLSDKARANAKKLPMLNPQTQIETIG
jgi:hypothetical protein